MTGPACGNNPNYRMSDGDRQAVDSFRAYLTARGALQRIRTVLETEAVVGRTALEYRGLITAALMADETAATEMQAAEDPARIDRLRPEFFEHASLESIDVQIQRAQRQQRNWGNRERTLGILRQARLTQKEHAEEPAVEQPFVPPAHYRRDDDVDCCVHAIPVGPDSCRACRELADAEAAAGARQDGAQPS